MLCLTRKTLENHAWITSNNIQLARALFRGRRNTD